MDSWGLEGSIDDRNWTEIDPQTRFESLKTGWPSASFAVLNPIKCRFIRLIGTDQTYGNASQLWMFTVEFFGTLSEQSPIALSFQSKVARLSSHLNERVDQK
jgi:hypothetical protein